MGRGGVLALVLVLALGACAKESPPADDGVWLVEEGAVWCYRTLAEVDCRTRPEPGAAHRLVGVGPRRSFLPALAEPSALAKPETWSPLPAAEDHGPLQLLVERPSRLGLSDH